MRTILKSTVFVVCLLVFSRVYAGEVKSLVAFDYYDKDYYRNTLKLEEPPQGFVFTDQRDLLVFCEDLIVDGAREVSRMLRKHIKDFSKHIVLVLVGEDSTINYNIRINQEATVFSDGILDVVVNIDKPTRELTPEGSRQIQKSKPKNPIYIYYTDADKVPSDEIKKVNFYRIRPDGHKELFSQWICPEE